MAINFRQATQMLLVKMLGEKTAAKHWQISVISGLQPGHYHCHGKLIEPKSNLLRPRLEPCLTC